MIPLRFFVPFSCCCGGYLANLQDSILEGLQEYYVKLKGANSKAADWSAFATTCKDFSSIVKGLEKLCGDASKQAQETYVEEVKGNFLEVALEVRRADAKTIFETEDLWPSFMLKSAPVLAESIAWDEDEQEELKDTAESLLQHLLGLLALDSKAPSAEIATNISETSSSLFKVRPLTCHVEWQRGGRMSLRAFVIPVFCFSN